MGCCARQPLCCWERQAQSSVAHHIHTCAQLAMPTLLPYCLCAHSLNLHPPPLVCCNRFAVVEFLLPYRCPSDYEDVLCGGGTGQNTCNGDSGACSLPLSLPLPLPLQFNAAISMLLRLRCRRAAALPSATALAWHPAPGEPLPFARCACPACRVCGMLSVSCMSCVWHAERVLHVVCVAC